ncbi:MAG TPA: enoyl-CoA hydratase-related protein [Jatrophihabitans sp.]|nr:enoyl-CoA hydratase-related protein [Jatrophihabitans sp.]
MPVDYDVAGSVATITLNAPERRNALSPALLGDLTRHLQQAAADDRIRSVVLSHTGGTFCSGMDLNAVTERAAADQPIAAFPEVLQRIWEFDKPVIARVDGKARAGGIGLVAAADLAVASPAADFAFTEVRLGLVPAVISVPALPRLAPRALLELSLTGETFDAARAAEIGLLSAVTERLDHELARYTAMFELAEPAALAATKRMLRRDRGGVSMAEDFAAMSELSARHFASAEAAEGIAAFREKRRPRWADRASRRGPSSPS